MQFTDSTPREEYTIAGKTFKIVQPYNPGHVLTAGEASQLNQVFAENIRNNFAGNVEDADEAGSFDQDSMQLSLDEYMSQYEMGARRSGGRTGDPVKAEFMAIAREKIKAKLKKDGKNLKDYKASQITDLAQQYWDNKETKAAAVLALAQKRVKEREELAEVELDDAA